MTFYKDPNGKPHALPSEEFEHLLPPGSLRITNEEYENLVRTPPATKAQRITAVTAEYNADVKALREAWLAAAVADGVNEASTKATITANLTERKTQFLADVAAIRAS